MYQYNKKGSCFPHHYDSCVWNEIEEGRKVINASRKKEVSVRPWHHPISSSLFLGAKTAFYILYIPGWCTAKARQRLDYFFRPCRKAEWERESCLRKTSECKKFFSRSLYAVYVPLSRSASIFIVFKVTEEVERAGRERSHFFPYFCYEILAPPKKSRPKFVASCFRR